MNFDSYRPDFLDESSRENIVCFSDPHLYDGGSEDEARYVARTLNGLLKYSDADEVWSLGDTGSRVNVEALLETLDAEDIVLVKGDEDRRDQGYNERTVDSAVTDADVEFVDGAHAEQINGWDVAAAHHPHTRFGEESQDKFDAHWVGDSLYYLKESNIDRQNPEAPSTGFDMVNYGHSHIPYPRPAVMDIWNSPGSIKQSKNISLSEDVPLSTAQILSFGQDVVDVMTIDAEAHEVWEHRRFGRNSGNLMEMEEVVGPDIGVERAHRDALQRSGIDPEERQDFDLNQAIVEIHNGTWEHLDGAGPEETERFPQVHRR